VTVLWSLSPTPIIFSDIISGAGQFFINAIFSLLYELIDSSFTAFYFLHKFKNLFLFYISYICCIVKKHIFKNDLCLNLKQQKPVFVSPLLSHSLSPKPHSRFYVKSFQYFSFRLLHFWAMIHIPNTNTHFTHYCYYNLYFTASFFLLSSCLTGYVLELLFHKA
jgi:hypothetical protein